MTAVDILNTTEELLKTEGWGRLHHPGCILNRMYQSVGLRFGHVVEKDHIELHMAANAVRQVIGTKNVTLWNDELGRTLDEVLAAIDGARQTMWTLP